MKIPEACPHTIKKFELIEAYVEAWAQKLLQYKQCSGIVFIDCMSNSGIYKDAVTAQVVYGTPIRVSALLVETMKQYPHKKALLYFNDKSSKKIKLLKENLPANTSNLEIFTSVMDGNELLRRFQIEPGIHYLLVYDPFEASIEWAALTPFLNGWSEVILNHMVSDVVRGLPQATSDATKAKYVETYQMDIDGLLAIGCDYNSFEHKIHEIITRKITTGRRHFIASFPFINRKNGHVYNLIHCTGNIKGFKLFKTTAWKTFGGRSSIKNTHGLEKQLMFPLDGETELIIITDEDCYNVSDIASYLCGVFKGRKDVPFDDVYGALMEHPIFPSEGFRDDIKKELKQYHGVTSSRSTMTFP